MQAASQLDETQTAHRIPIVRRVWAALGAMLLLLLMALLPPYLNVNRFQRRITQSISESLGRPVHLDHVTLNLLPVPGFTLERFVVSEDPAFGAEPTIRAESVRATLRVSTLWRRRIEIGTISLTEPSVNLVHLADGRWNLDSILLQTARLGAAPTEQRGAGAVARFPYIEATAARVNLKMDQEKTPIALTEADFAMWLPRPERWNFRIRARPARTNVPVGYTGLLRVEGTLGRAATLGEIPIDLSGEWRGVPLGEMSRILLGRDGEWRGAATVTAAARGTVGNNRVTARLRVEDARRADFVPERLLSVTAECGATVTNAFHGVREGMCRVPAEGDPALVTAVGSLEDVRRPRAAVATVKLGPIPAAGVVELLHTLSARVPPGLAVSGMLQGIATYGVEAAGTLGGSLLLQGATLQPAAGEPIPLGDVAVQLGEPSGRGRARPRSAPTALTLLPATLGLGGREPASLEGTLDRQGYTLHLSGAAVVDRLLALGRAVPQFGDGLSDALPHAATGPVRLDLTAQRPWGSSQVWQAAPTRPAVPTRRRRARR